MTPCRVLITTNHEGKSRETGKYTVRHSHCTREYNQRNDKGVMSSAVVAQLCPPQNAHRDP